MKTYNITKLTAKLKTSDNIQYIKYITLLLVLLLLFIIIKYMLI